MLTKGFVFLDICEEYSEAEILQESLQTQQGESQQAGLSTIKPLTLGPHRRQNFLSLCC